MSSGSSDECETSDEDYADIGPPIPGRFHFTKFEIFMKLQVDLYENYLTMV